MGWDLLATEPPLRTFNEIGETTDYGKSVLLRRTSLNGHLLIKIFNEDIVYRWDLNRGTGERVDRSLWDRSQEDITVCGDSRQIGREKETFDTYGRYLLSSHPSPREGMVAVVSAYGPKGPAMPGLIFGLGGGEGRIFGTRYLEIKENRPGFPTIGRPIRMRDFEAPSACWSNDERFVVLFDEVYRISVLDRTREAVSEVTDLEVDQSKVQRKHDLSGFTGSIRDYGVDEDNDGLFETVAFEIETETRLAGPYTISLTLISSEGKMEGTVVDANLTEGLQSTVLTLDTSKWFIEQASNQFEIRYLSLRLGDLDVDLRENVGKTKKYDHLQFKSASTPQNRPPGSNNKTR
jgi:hypothetical protein